MFVAFGYNFVHQLTLMKTISSQKQCSEHTAYQYFNNLPTSFSSKAEQYFPIVVAFYIIGIFSAAYL